MSTCLHVQDPSKSAMSSPVSKNERLISVVDEISTCTSTEFFMEILYLDSRLHLLSFASLLAASYRTLGYQEKRNYELKYFDVHSMLSILMDYLDFQRIICPLISL